MLRSRLFFWAFLYHANGVAQAGLSAHTPPHAFSVAVGYPLQSLARVPFRNNASTYRNDIETLPKINPFNLNYSQKKHLSVK